MRVRSGRRFGQNMRYIAGLKRKRAITIVDQGVVALTKGHSKDHIRGGEGENESIHICEEFGAKSQLNATLMRESNLCSIRQDGCRRLFEGEKGKPMLAREIVRYSIKRCSGIDKSRD